jgi:hypothetical protein
VVIEQCSRSNIGTTQLEKYRKVKYDKQDQQGKVAFNERNPHTNEQQNLEEPKQKQDMAQDRVLAG